MLFYCRERRRTIISPRSHLAGKQSPGFVRGIGAAGANTRSVSGSGAFGKVRLAAGMSSYGFVAAKIVPIEYKDSVFKEADIQGSIDHVSGSGQWLSGHYRLLTTL